MESILLLLGTFFEVLLILLFPILPGFDFFKLSSILGELFAESSLFTLLLSTVDFANFGFFPIVVGLFPFLSFFPINPALLTPAFSALSYYYLDIIK